MMNKKRLTYASLIGVASVLACVVQAVDTVVPDQWNVTPWTDGSKLEQFSSLPPWASNEALVTSSARPDFRFWAATSPEKAMSFATLGITNTFSGAKIQIGTPVFIDMRCKLNPFDTTPPAMEPNTILCFYANQNSNLVVASATECKTNLVTVNPSTYYPIMVRFAVDKFDVFFDTTNAPTLTLNATTNEISKMVISGAGEMDDLYVSYGNPFRTSANSGADLSPTPTTEEEFVVANWLANKAPSGSYTQGNAEKFYLTDTIPTSPTTTFDGELGIGSFSYDPSTLKVSVVVTLKTDASTKKTGKINGVLKLKGAATYADAKNGTWSGVLDAVKIGADDFTDGVATYTFTLQNADNKFFLPVIQSQIN